MKYAYLGIGIILAGMFGVVFLVMFESITVNNESEYYVLKEAMEASMLESVDIDCFRNDTLEGCGGVVKISEQKFVENFTRRFAASISGNIDEYEIQFYDIIESPPKASIVITGLTGDYVLVSGGDSAIGITNSLSGILEHNLFATSGTDSSVPNFGSGDSIDAPNFDSSNVSNNNVYVPNIEIQEICNTCDDVALEPLPEVIVEEDTSVEGEEEGNTNEEDVGDGSVDEDDSLSSGGSVPSSDTEDSG